MRKACVGVVFALVSYLTCASDLCAQAFTNLDFESATLVPIPGDPYNRVYFGLALPGWTGYSGTNQLTAALYDNIFLDSTGIGIIDTNSHYFGGVIQGNYTAFLEAGLSLSGGGSANASLSQTGLVPNGAKSLSFLAVTNGPFAVSLGGTILNLISSPVAGQNYSLFQADISAFAGQTNELDFTVFAQDPYNNQIHSMLLDDILFSPDAIPEPSSLSLAMVGIVVLYSMRYASRATTRTANAESAVESNC
jgi:hypothetical protein